MRIAIVVVSDRASDGTYEDLTGPAVASAVGAWPGSDASAPVVVPDERELIAATLGALTSQNDLVLTAGGTGLGPRDVTPEATIDVVERQVPGIAEAMRARGLEVTPMAALSRQVAGVKGECLIVNLPGSPKGAVEGVQVLEPFIAHAIRTIKGGGH